MYLSERPLLDGGLFNPRKFEEDYDDFNERLRKTLYYGKLPGTDRPSLPVTELMVDFYNEAAPRQLGKLDSYLAASTARSACMSTSASMVGMLYVKRLKSKRPDYLTQVSSSELFLISMMMASKFLYDEGIDDEVFNDEWANSGDLETEDVNQLEIDFLKAIDWNLFVRNQEFSDMLRKIEQRVALQQSINRGWFTYTDLFILSQDLRFDWSDLTMDLSTVISASSLAYFAGLLTMVASTMLGTMTSTTLINTGSTMLPLALKMMPGLSLSPALSSNVLDMFSRSEISKLPALRSQGLDSVDLIPRTEVAEVNMTEETVLPKSSVALESDADEEEQDVKTSPCDPDLSDSVKVTHRDHGGILNRFLPPFLAIVTLKDTLFNFAYGAGLFSESNKLETESNDLEVDVDLDLEESSSMTFDLSDLEEFCSSGPCLVDTWKNCRNVTVISDWTVQNRYTGNGLPCCYQCSLSVDYDYHHGNSQVDDIIHCCCDLENDAMSWLRGSLNSELLQDINLRFSTRSGYPILVTT